jgi:hypothetical protein
MVFKNSGLRARDIGETLRADYLLEGSSRRERERVRITARLIESANETQLWVDTYERDLTDCLSIQKDVTSRIARSLAMELIPDEMPNLAETDSSNASACEPYLTPVLKMTMILGRETVTRGLRSPARCQNLVETYLSQPGSGDIERTTP